jgi:tetratricopeptide (TPR) repeat protein
MKAKGQVLYVGDQTMTPSECFIWRASIAVIVAGGAAAWGGQKADPGRIEDPLARADWQGVIKECERYDSNALKSSPALRAIRGHACLALNRNNESLALFASLAREADERQWLAWTKRFTDQHKDAAVADYLEGDALARLGDWKAALQFFDRALARTPNWHLALNARGVVQHAMGNTSAARADFKNAIAAKPDFADAYASRGTIDVYAPTIKGSSTRNQGPAEWFQRSVDLSPRSVVALNGLGCAAYTNELYPEAKRYFDAIPADSPLSLVAKQNALAAELYQLVRLMWQACDAGMTVQRVEVPGKPGHFIEAGLPGDSQLPRIPWNRLPPEDYPDEIGTVLVLEDGTIVIHYVTCRSEVIPPPEPDDGGEDGGGEDGSKNPMIVPPLPNVQLIHPLPLLRVPVLIGQVEALNARMQQSVSSFSPPGGVDGRKVKSVRTTRKEGRWHAYSLYGLSYRVPEEFSRTPQPSKSGKTKN